MGQSAAISRVFARFLNAHSHDKRQSRRVKHEDPTRVLINSERVTRGDDSVNHGISRDIRTLGNRLNRCHYSNAAFFLSIFIPLTTLYAITAQWQLPQDTDSITNSITAWSLGNRGSPILDDYSVLAEPARRRAMGSFTTTPAGTVSFAPPGAPLLAAPVYAVTDGSRQEVRLYKPYTPDYPPVPVSMPAVWQATLVAVVTTAAAIGLLGLCFRLQGAPSEAWLAAMLAGLGTSAWSVASTALWQHGPAIFWLALGILLSTRASWTSSGMAFAAAIATRPHTAVIPACVGIGAGICRRSFAPIIKIGLISGASVLLLLAYNFYIYRRITLVGAYGQQELTNLVAGDGINFAANLLGACLDPKYGVFIWSPFLIVLLPGLIPGWRNSPCWVRYAAVGGVLYLLLQFKLHTYAHKAATPYRYPLEGLTATAPLWFAAYRHRLRELPTARRRPLRLAALSAIFLQAFALLVWVAH